MVNMNNLLEPLKGEIFVSNEEVSDAAILLAEKIFNDKYKRRGRSYDQVFKSCFYGRIAEVGVKKLLKAEDKLDVFNDAWDVKDRSTYGCDLIAVGMRVEVKSQKGEWFDMPNDGLKTLRNNIAAKVLDVVVTASYKQSENGYVVTPRFIIDPYKMLQYVKPSHYRDNKSFFDHHSALRAGDCITVR